MPKSFLDLPAELRNAIYEGTLPKTKTIYIRNGQIIVHPLLLVCRQTRHEYHPFHEAHVNAAEWVEADVVNWDFRHVNRFFDTTHFHQLGDMPKLKIRIILDDPAVAFDQGIAGAAFEHWFSKPYKVPYIVPHQSSNAYSGGNIFFDGSSASFSGGGSSMFGNGGSSLFGNGRSSLFGGGRSSIFGGGGSSLFSNAGSSLFGGGGSSLFSNGGSSLFGVGRSSPFGNGGSSLSSVGANPPSSNGGSTQFATAGSPMLPNGGGSSLFAGGGSSLFSRGSTLSSSSHGVDLIINYDLQVDWNKYDTTSLEHLVDRIEDWFRKGGNSIVSLAVKPAAGKGLTNVMRQTLRSRQERDYLETYRLFLTNSKPTRWPGMDDGIENDVKMIDNL